jgi:hypothetical protein
MSARYSREVIGNRSYLVLTVGAEKHYLTWSPVPESIQCGPALNDPAPVANNPVVALSRPATVRVRTFNLRRAVAAEARRRCTAPLGMPPAASTVGHLAWHDGREYVVVGGRVYSAPSEAPLGANGYKRGLRYFGTVAAFRLWASRNRVRGVRRSNNPVVANL